MDIGIFTLRPGRLLYCTIICFITFHYYGIGALLLTFLLACDITPTRK